MFKVKAFVSLSFLLFFFSTITLAQKASKNMVPVLNAISPSSTTAGGASLTLTVTGSNFTSGSVVRWNGSSLTTTVVNSTQLQAVVGSSLVADAGAARITVFTSGRWGGPRIVSRSRLIPRRQRLRLLRHPHRPLPTR